MNEHDEVRLRHILDEANRVQRFIKNKNRDDLQNDDMLSYAVVRAIEIIGEAASKITSETREAYPQIQWKNIIGMRNRVIHNYENVDLDIVWEVSIRNLPELIAELQNILPPFKED